MAQRSSDRRAVRVSKFLARHLRHRPGELGLELQPGGWVDVAELLEACRRSGFPIAPAELDAAVNAAGKRRYAYDATQARVRAVQGHSVAVELGYAPSCPPAILYHGTHAGAVKAIRRQGLRPMGRLQVHLSADEQTARTVGARRGKPVVLTVDAAAMADAGYRFWDADNGVWLVDEVPARHLSIP